MAGNVTLVRNEIMLDHRHSTVVVIGGGIIGLACAYYLNRAGRQVCLIDKATAGGDEGACYGNCGLLFFSDLPPLCQPGALADAMIRMTRRSSPLYIKPQPDLPIIGAAPKNTNLFIATGHGMIGLTAATATAELVTDLIAGRQPAIDATPFRPTRFA
jgi:glycine/D-amino acid oxidase-like deaminating enzyme